MKGKQEPIAVRFARFVHVTEGCHFWTGSGAKTKGYGKIGLNGTMRWAHRVAYELAVGPIPAGAWVLHTCDTPLCVNPAHLYLGDRSRNMKDAHERGRIDLHKVASAPRPRARKQSRY